MGRCSIKKVDRQKEKDREGQKTSERLVSICTNYEQNDTFKTNRQNIKSKASKQLCETDRHPNVEDIQTEMYQCGWKKR